jgi:hypothetical protein
VDVFIDIAREDSACTDTCGGLTGTTTFPWDIIYGDRIIGSRLKSNACRDSVPHRFADVPGVLAIRFDFLALSKSDSGPSIGRRPIRAHRVHVSDWQHGRAEYDGTMMR